MVAFIPIRLRLPDIILHIKNADILLPCNHLCNLINILGKGTDNADSCNITQLLHHIVNRDLQSVPLQLFYNAVRSFQSGFNMFDRSMPVNMDKLSV